MFACGSSSCGQLGLGVSEEVNVSSFKQVSFFDNLKIISINSGREHTQVLTTNGTSRELFSFGGNDSGECGRSVKSGSVRPSLANFESCGSFEIDFSVSGTAHNISCSSDGRVSCWGSNTDSQTGLQESDANTDGIFDLPKILKFPEPVSVRVVGAGSKHSVAIATTGVLYMWGSNAYGQLGLGKDLEVVKHPTVLKGVEGLPVSKIACGGYHTFFTTISGRVFACGRNGFGQLGIGDTTNRHVLTRLNNLKPYFVLKIAAGEQHSMFLCSKIDRSAQSEKPKVTLMSCGSGSNGQLGFSSESPVLSPIEVLWSDNLNLADISCGRKHTLGLTEDGKVLACGLNNLGQLGTGDCNDVHKLSEVANLPGRIGLIATGGDQSFCVLESSLVKIERKFPIERIDLSFARQFIKNPSDVSTKFGATELKSLLEAVFTNAACLNSSFLYDYPAIKCQSSPQESSVDMEIASNFFATLCEMYNSSYNRALTTSVDTLVQSATRAPADIECLRFYLPITQCYIMENTLNWQNNIVPVAVHILRLNTSAQKTLKYWFRNLDSRYLTKILSVYKELINYFVLTSTKGGKEVLQNEQVVKSLMICLRILEFFHSVNEMKGNSEKLPPNRFYVKELTNRLDIENDFVVWLQKKTSAQNAKCNTVSSINDPFKVVPVCDFPFVFDVASKSCLLACEAMIKMQRVVTHLQLQSLMTANFAGMACPFLVLCISRDNLVDSTLNQLLSCDDFDLRKPLKVIFEGEDAIDAGGVKKEFFMLILREILDIKYGMFKIMGNSKWFNDIFEEELRLFRMIGMICGLAIYNQTIIDLMFPMVLYKKLLDKEVGLQDLYSLDEQLAKQLDDLKNYEGEDVEETFCLNFQVAKDFYGTTVVHDLIPDGGNVPVTHENKEHFVSVYVNYILNESIRKQYYEFSTGFYKVVQSDVLKFFQPQELHELISGSSKYDFFELETTTTYKGEFNADHPVIRNFWTVIHEMSQEMKLKFLLFLTGTERVPVNGMKSLQFTIQPTHGGEEYLPVAHTCFNLLDLPLYRDLETLRQKLKFAIEQTEGFALV